MADVGLSAPQQPRGVRVVVRVRPVLSSDGDAQQTLLNADPGRQEVVIHGAHVEAGQQGAQGAGAGKRYAFDSVFGPQTAQASSGSTWLKTVIQHSCRFCWLCVDSHAQL